jgi:hypothetical protein
MPYTQRVPAAQREAFIADVVERFVARHPLDSTGTLTVPMVRLEIEALRIGAPSANAPRARPGLCAPRK